MRATFVECPKKFYWSFVRKLGPREGSADLVAGGAFARGLEVARKLYYLDGLDKWKAIEHGIAEAIIHYGDFECPPHKEQKSLDRVIEAIGYYFTVWPMDTDYIKPHLWDGGGGIEFTFSLPMDLTHPDTGEPLIYAGRSDMIAEYNKQLWVVDEKSTSQLGSTWADKWNLRSQFTGYCKATQSFGLPVVGAIIRGIAFLKQTKQNPSGFNHAEAMTARPQWMIDRWWEQLHRDVERMIYCYKEGYFDYNLDESCNAYGGCSFTKLCLTPKPEAWIEGSYSLRDWNPLHKQPQSPSPQTTWPIPPIPLQD